MGDLGDFYRDCNEAVKQRREQKRQRYEPMLEEIGAKYKSAGQLRVPVSVARYKGQK